MHSKQRSTATEGTLDAGTGSGAAQIRDFSGQSQQNSSDAPDRVKRQAIIVLGMHRSGTSVLTQALGHVGVRLPARMLEAAADNQRGFFEPTAIVEIHERILASAGTSWSDWEAFPTEWYKSAEAAVYTRELIEAVQTEYGDAPLFVVKDPRICRLLPLWIRVLSEIGAEPILLLASSMIRGARSMFSRKTCH
jgi:hypothetical protein